MDNAGDQTRCIAFDVFESGRRFHVWTRPSSGRIYMIGHEDTVIFELYKRCNESIGGRDLPFLSLGLCHLPWLKSLFHRRQ
jgi:hypothetical protein